MVLRRSLLARLGLPGRGVRMNRTLYRPRCGAGTHERMPLDRTVHAFRCLWCDSEIRHPDTKHCVYCAFGSRKCPERQAART